jgi:DNA-binding NarL/FixJ family response regulator
LKLYLKLKKSRFSDIPLVVFSTAGDYAVVEQCEKLGAKLYIKKVNSLRDLKKAIEFTIGIDWNNFNPDGSKFLYRNSGVY